MSAVISPCGLYRYRLERTVAATGPVFAFFGVNPSMADASVDDATVRKWKGFVSRWGGSRFIVGNVFAYRATDVRSLATVDDPHGPDHCDRIIWRNQYFHLPLKAAPQPDECAAHGDGHRFGPHGINGGQQCEWCGHAAD